MIPHMTHPEDDSRTLHDRGVQAGLRGELALAQELIGQAIRLSPAVPLYYLNLGIVFDKSDRPDQALDAFQIALSLKPDSVPTLIAQGNGLMRVGRADEALAVFQKASDIDPQNVTAASCRLFFLQFHPGFDAQAILREHQLWNHRFAQPMFSHTNDPSPDRPLRVAYISPNLYRHCIAVFVAPLLANHDREHFKIYCYADVANPDGVTAQLRASADVWQSIAGMTDAKVAERIHADKIDILVDLVMHMGSSRPLAIARKPAPVQANWLAYPGTSGIPAVDYRLTDPFLDPSGADDRYTEKSVRLPDTYWCYDRRILRLGPEPEPGPLPAARNGFITFGSLNNFWKINPPILALWSRVLTAVPQSRLRLVAPLGSARQRTLQTLQSLGVDPARVDFVPIQTRQLYLAEFQQIDIGLDPLPYNGHTTSLDTMWMGVPVITRVGRTVVGRAGLSQLSNLKLTELVAHDDDQFVHIARHLAADLPRLTELRRTLRDRMLHSPLCDAPRFTRNMESAFRQMWQTWCHSRRPPT
jgi:protein O-GlcNAc transferase